MIDATIEIYYWTKNKESLEILTRNLLNINAEVTPEVFTLLTRYEAIKEDLHNYLLHEDFGNPLFQTLFDNEIYATTEKVFEVLEVLTKLVGMHKVTNPIGVKKVANSIHYPVVVFVPTDENPLIVTAEEDFYNAYCI